MARQNVRVGGAPKVRYFRVDEDSVITKGMMLWLDDSGDHPVVRPASELSWDSDLATTQAAFAEVFVGLAMQGSAEGESEDICVDISEGSVWKMECASATFADNAYVGPANNSSVLHNTKVVACVAAAAIGVVDRYEPVATTNVECRFSGLLNIQNTNAEIG